MSKRTTTTDQAAADSSTDQVDNTSSSADAGQADQADQDQAAAGSSDPHPLSRIATVAELQAAGVCNGWSPDRIEAALRAARVMT